MALEQDLPANVPDVPESLGAFLVSLASRKKSAGLSKNMLETIYSFEGPFAQKTKLIPSVVTGFKEQEDYGRFNFRMTFGCRRFTGDPANLISLSSVKKQLLSKNETFGLIFIFCSFFQ